MRALRVKKMKSREIFCYLLSKGYRRESRAIKIRNCRIQLYEEQISFIGSIGYLAFKLSTEHREYNTILDEIFKH